MVADKWERISFWFGPLLLTALVMSMVGGIIWASIKDNKYKYDATYCTPNNTKCEYIDGYSPTPECPKSYDIGGSFDRNIGKMVIGTCRFNKI